MIPIRQPRGPLRRPTGAMYEPNPKSGGAGTVVERSDAGGLRFSRVVFPPRAILGPHVHPNAYLSFVSAGSYTERVGHVVRECESSTLLYHEAGERHENVFHAEPVSLLRVEALDSELLDRPLGASASDAFRDAGLPRRGLRGTGHLSIGLAIGLGVMFAVQPGDAVGTSSL